MVTRLVGAEQGPQARFSGSCPGSFPEPSGENWVCFRADMTAVQIDMTVGEEGAEGAEGAVRC